MTMTSARRFDNKSASVFMAVLVIAVAALTVNQMVECAEQDAELLKPLASLAKSLISTITQGEMLKVDFEVTNIGKSLVSLGWRTGFPVTMPKGFIEKSKDFYNRIRDRVYETDVSELERKTLANLKVDLDDIVDAIVEEVRTSPDGLYTNYLDTKVNGVPFEEACYNVGIQLKAYGIDLSNYRNIASKVLGVPLMPQVASTVIGAGNLATNPTNIVQLPGAALKTVSQMSDSTVNRLLRPINLFRSTDESRIQGTLDTPTQIPVQ